MFKGRTQNCSNEGQDFFLLFKQMQAKSSLMELERWTVTAWAIWKAWNKFYFEQVQVHPRVILESASGLLEDYQRMMAAQV